MSAHTPGPWEVRQGVGLGERYATVEAFGRRYPTCEIATTQGHPFGPEELANAHLGAVA